MTSDQKKAAKVRCLPPTPPSPPVREHGDACVLRRLLGS